MDFDYITVNDIDNVVQEIKKRTKYRPKIGMILGSGLGALADEIHNPEHIDYKDLPKWPESTIQGHIGRLVIGELQEHQVVVMQGRSHYYEGHNMNLIGLPVRAMQRLGVETIFITNSAGAINPDFNPGELMLINDHINFVGLSGHGPLLGPNLEEFGPRFPDMSQIYDRKLMVIAREVAKERKIILQEGVYIAISGPQFESPAELRFLHGIGVDAVGMSTAPEATVARQGGLRVLGISGISNKANLDGEIETTHEEVLEAGKTLAPQLISLIKGVLNKL